MARLLCLTLLLIQLSVSPVAGLSLELIAEQNLPYDAMVAGTWFNGLSGLVYEQEKGCFYAVSDDRSYHQPARYYRIEAAVAGERNPRISLTPKEVVFFRDAKGERFKRGQLDLEGITLLTNHHLLVSSEGSVLQGRAPSITEFQQDGSWVRSWLLPPQFLPAGQGDQGVRENLGCESLSVTPDGAFVFTANEQALKQDGERATVAAGSPIRIVKYDRTGKVLGHYPYLVSPIPNPLGLNAFQADNGLVELLALDEENLLSLERSWLPAGNKVSLRIYHLKLHGVEDVSGLASLQGIATAFVKKSLVLDLETLLPLADEAYPSLDNMEGMSFGPELADGSRTLVLVSDGNFSPRQRTLFLIFRLR
ncbi:esterase-like activity of phytase family protein [Desulfogranum mediterraneum]|uniref:esterase-like activity of phytase family protein n=1 Tax=Desulfogranum mediterraneum TaxID=160661 RepID=UPI00041B45DC|nr:esterase-like activity of phytase family protein [Desulfogranum mediterraneum]